MCIKGEPYVESLNISTKKFKSVFPYTVYPKKYAHGFVVLCFVVVMQSFIMNSHEVFIHIHQGCFAGTGAIVRLPQCQWSKPDGYGKISQCITTTMHSKEKQKPCAYFLGYTVSQNPTRLESLLDFLESQIHIFVYYDVSLQSQTKVSENQTTRKVEFLLLLDPLSTPHQPSTNVAANGTGQGLTVRALAAMKRYIIWIFVYVPHITISQYKRYSLFHYKFCPLIGHTTILIVNHDLNKNIHKVLLCFACFCQHFQQWWIHVGFFVSAWEFSSICGV